MTPTSLSNNKTNTNPREGGKTYRISARIRTAIDAIARDGTTQREAARRSGMNETALGKALAKPHVQIALEQAKALYSMEIDKLRGTAKALAIQTGLELMRNSKSDTIKARMVEFFAGEPRQPLVNVNIPAQDRGIYSYAKPISESVAQDSLSGASGRQPIEIEGKVIKPVQQGRSQVPGKADGA